MGYIGNQKDIEQDDRLTSLEKRGLPISSFNLYKIQNDSNIKSVIKSTSEKLNTATIRLRTDLLKRIDFLSKLYRDKKIAGLEALKINVKNIDDNIDILNGDVTTRGSVKHAMSTIIGGNSDKLNTLKEITDYLAANDGKNTDMLLTKMTNNKKYIVDVEKKLTTGLQDINNRIDTLSTEVDNMDDGNGIIGDLTNAFKKDIDDLTDNLQIYIFESLPVINGMATTSYPIVGSLVDGSVEVFEQQQHRATSIGRYEMWPSGTGDQRTELDFTGDKHFKDTPKIRVSYFTLRKYV